MSDVISAGFSSSKLHRYAVLEASLIVLGVHLGVLVASLDVLGVNLGVLWSANRSQNLPDSLVRSFTGLLAPLLACSFVRLFSRSFISSLVRSCPRLVCSLVVSSFDRLRTIAPRNKVMNNLNEPKSRTDSLRKNQQTKNERPIEAKD